MYSKTTSAAVLALAASMVSAQTSTECNPLEKSCPPDPAFGNGKVNCDLTSGLCPAFHMLDGTTLKYSGQGAAFSIQQESNAPTIRTGKYLFFGRVDVEMQAAPGNGIVTAAVLQSDDLDEIDWEWVGGDDAQAQSNYFSKGDDSTFDRGAYHSVGSPLSSFHTYSFEWTKSAVNWIIDGKVVRTLKASDVGEAFPQTPMQVKLGTWCAGGKNSPEGTAEWAGGRTDFSQAPFVAYYKSVSIIDYAGGDGPASNSVREYVYGDHSGSADSIVIKNGNGGSSGGNGGDDEDKPSTTTTKVPETTTTAVHSTTHVPKTTTTAPETTTKETTMTTVSSVAHNTTTAGDATTTSGSDSGSETTTSAPSQVTQDDAAVRSIASFGSLAIAGAVVLAQLML